VFKTFWIIRIRLEQKWSPIRLRFQQYLIILPDRTPKIRIGNNTATHSSCAAVILQVTDECFQIRRSTDGPVSSTFQKEKKLIVAHWLVKYIKKIFSGFGFHICVANRIRIWIPTSWTGLESDSKKLGSKHLCQLAWPYTNISHSRMLGI